MFVFTNRWSYNRIVELLAVNQNKSKLPQPRVPVEYRSFIRAFERLVENQTFSSTERLYYLKKYIAGDAKELVPSCHHLPSDEGYEEARKLLKRKFGDEYNIASAYESKAIDRPTIKSEDGTAPSKFPVFLSSCKNSLASRQYVSKFDQSGNIQKLVLKLPCKLRERWHHSLDDIVGLQSRPATFCDVIAFVYRRTRSLKTQSSDRSLKPRK